MGLIWTQNGPYHQATYQSKADLESAILQVQQLLFGANRIYLPIKKKIGSKGGVCNIPDGYLIDLTGKQPRLYVVENELAAHDPLRHIAVQILQFSLSFESEGRGVKAILFSAIQDHPQFLSKCEAYAHTHQFRNLDHLLEHLVFESPFAALVIIDELPENLENVLVKKFQFGVEVLELAKYENDTGDSLFRFEPFLADLEQDLAPSDTGEFDTVVVPARSYGVAETFLGENRWHAIRIHATMRPQIKYLALYQVAPISAITHIASVKSIEPWKDTGKYVVNFSSPAQEIGPIKHVKKGRVKALLNIRYTTRTRLENAKTLDDIW
ncbi:MAG: hypothetical protein JXB10_11395 [Pirellulales bacterium]|nr:hypothetical protein [Pirellulales bacterium]